VGCGLRNGKGKKVKQNAEGLAMLMRLKGKDFGARSGVFHGGAAVATPADVRHRGARAERHRGGATAVAKGRPTRGEGQHEVDGGDCKAAARGGAQSPASVREQRSRRGAEEEEGKEKSRDSFANSKSYRDPAEN
jgi:hypothetical protein